jgi:hypothetical protein
MAVLGSARPRRARGWALAVVVLSLAAGVLPATAQTQLQAPSISAEAGAYDEQGAWGGAGTAATVSWWDLDRAADGIEIRMVETDEYDPSPPREGAVVCRSAGRSGRCTATGLDSTKSYVFRAFAYTGSTYSPGSAHKVGGTSISSSALPLTVVYGNVVTVTGRLAARLTSSRWVGHPGETVELQYRPLRRDGAWGMWTTLATQTTDDYGEDGEPGPSRSGEYTFRHKTQRRSQYRVLYRSGPDRSWFAAESPVHQVQVAPKVTAALSTTSMRLGGTARLSGTVAPKLAGQTVELQRRRADGTWAVIATQKLSDTSGYRFSIKPTRRGTTTYRVRIRAQTLYAKGVSPARTLKVT